MYTGIVIVETGTDFVPPPACVLTVGAGGFIFKIISRKAVGDEQLGALALEGEVFLPERFDGGAGVRAAAQGGGNELGHY